MEFKCPVCHFRGLYEEPYDIDGYGSYEICPCCGFQFGYDDFPDKDEGQLVWRKKWIDEGYTWFSKTRIPPKGWEGEKQLEEE